MECRRVNLFLNCLLDPTACAIAAIRIVSQRLCVLQHVVLKELRYSLFSCKSLRMEYKLVMYIFISIVFLMQSGV